MSWDGLRGRLTPTLPEGEAVNDLAAQRQFTDDADLVANGPAAASSTGQIVLVEEAESNRVRVRYSDGAAWLPTVPVHSVATYADAQTLADICRAGDYIDVEGTGGRYFVAEASSTRYLIPAYPFGPEGGRVTAATLLGAWEPGDASYGDFAETTNTDGTGGDVVSVDDDGSRIEVTTGAISAAGRLVVEGPTLTSSDTVLGLLVQDFAQTTRDAGGLTGTLANVSWVANAYVGASASHRAQYADRPGQFNNTYTADTYDGLGNYSAANTTHDIITTPEDVFVSCDGSADRYMSFESEGDTWPALGDENASTAGRYLDGQARLVNGAPPSCARLEFGQTFKDGLTVTEFTSATVWRLTVG